MCDCSPCGDCWKLSRDRLCPVSALSTVGESRACLQREGGGADGGQTRSRDHEPRPTGPLTRHTDTHRPRSMDRDGEHL